MRRALTYNLYGHEAAWHKLKNGQKTQKMHFLPVFELTLASLTAIWVEQNQCPLHQSILLTQGPDHKNFMKRYWELAELETEFFESSTWNDLFLLHLNESKQPVHMGYHLFLHYEWFLQNLGKDFIRTDMHMTLTYKKKPEMRQQNKEKQSEKH